MTALVTIYDNNRQEVEEVVGRRGEAGNEERGNRVRK